MDAVKIKQGLSEYPENAVDNYIAYLLRLEAEKKNNQPKNLWMKQRTPEFLIRIFKAVSDDGLVFDGDDITLQSTGVSYNYQAYKNKMLLAYPESLIDLSLVYNGDSFTFSKNSGRVIYNHEISNPFGHVDQDIIGAYCVIKNNRGEFLTTLSRAEIEKHRKVARTDYIWKNWYPEMCMKTVIKKACSKHFKDSFKTVETLDNENYDLDKLPPDPAQKTVQIGEDNVIWLTAFCKRQEIITDDDKKALKEHYKFDPYETSEEDFNTIKAQMQADHNEVE